jgi:hypothetical protein
LVLVPIGVLNAHKGVRVANATSSANAGRRYTIVGFVLAALGLILVPILFGPAGAIFGGIGYAKG